MNKRKFFLLPICLLLLGACNNNQPSSKEKESEPVSEHVHEFGQWKVTVLPTCTEKGQETRTCECGAEEKQDIDELGHLWDDGEMTTRPTVDAAGEKTFHCTRSGCDATKTEPIAKVNGYTVTFNQGEHFKVKVYKTQDYANETPTETYSCLARDKYGNAVEYDPADALDQPQINFKVEVDDGYKVGFNEISIAGTYKNFKAGPNDAEGLPEGFFRATKIQTNLTITITPVVDSGEEQHGFEATFITNHCSVVVYKGQTTTDENIDTEEHYYARNKNGAYLYDDQGQFNFKVVPEAGYKWDHGVTESEAACNTLPFIAGSCGNFKVVDADKNIFRITKVAADISILINCIPVAGEAGLGYEVTFVTEHCHVLVYQTQDYQFTPVAPVNNKTLTRTSKGDAAKYVAASEGVAEVKPQVNFLIVCDDGYSVAASNISISGTKGTEWNKLEQGDASVNPNIWKITKIKADLTVTITAVSA